jgi:hypothetical protein
VATTTSRAVALVHGHFFRGIPRDLFIHTSLDFSKVLILARGENIEHFFSKNLPGRNGMEESKINRNSNLGYRPNFLCRFLTHLLLPQYGKKETHRGNRRCTL